MLRYNPRLSLDRADAHIAWVPVIVSVIVQADILGNFFSRDDYAHLFSVANGPLEVALLAPHGGHLLLSYNAIFWLAHRLFGTNVSLYFVALLLAHAVNVRLLFLIIRRLTGRRYLAAFGACLWGMSPLNQGALGWISVLGHVSATTATLWVLYDMARLARGDIPLTGWRVVRVYLLLLVAATSFGVGIGVAMGFGAALFLWNPVPRQRTFLVLTLGSLALTVPAIYFGANWAWAQAVGDATATTPRIPSPEYWALIPWGLARLSAFGFSGLLLGPVVAGEVALLSGEVVTSLSLAIGLLGLVMAAYVCVVSSAERRRQVLALLLLVVCIYGLISVARFWISNLVQEPRYHYLAPALFAIVICLASSVLVRDESRLGRNGRTVFFAWLAVVLIPYLLATRNPTTAFEYRQRTQHYAAALILQTKIENHPVGSEVYIPNRDFELNMFQASEGSWLTFPGWAGLFVISYRDNTVAGRRVFFVEEDASVLRKAKAMKGTRIHDLLVPDRSQLAPRERSGRAGASN
jgi:hypothetical protein